MDRFLCCDSFIGLCGMFFERLGKETEVALFVLSASSWIIIYQSVQKLVLNSRKQKYESLVFSTQINDLYQIF